MGLQARDNTESEKRVPPYILDIYQDCTLEIQTDAGKQAAGAELMVYQVGRIDATSLSLSFVLNEEFEKSNADLMAEGNSKRSQTIETLYEYVQEQQIKPFQRVKLDRTGTKELQVPQGAYLICQTEENETTIQATLVGVPSVDESFSEWQYQMKVQLKADMNAVPTGDNQSGMLYAGVAVIALALLLVLCFARGRSRKMNG